MTSDEAMPRLSEQVAIVYRDAIDNLMFMKKQQWTATNYLVAIFAGVFAFSRADTTLDSFEKHALTFIVALALLYGIYLLLAVQRGMGKFRDRLTWITNTYFTSKEVAALKLPATPKSRFHNLDFLIGLIGVSVIAAILVFYSIWQNGGRCICASSV